MKKCLIALLLAAVTAVSASACSSPLENTETVTTPENSTITISTEGPVVTSTAESTAITSAIETTATSIAEGTTAASTTENITTTAATTAGTTTVTTTTVATTTAEITTAATTTEITTTTSKPEEPATKSGLSNPNASPEAVRLYNFICDTYGKAIISGQQESTWMGSEQYEFDYIYNNTGKYPAIRGLDYMNDDFSGVNRRAKEWHDRGGIVTICWHCGYDFSGSWDECMKTERSDWDQALTEGTAEYNKMIEQMDKAAKALKELKDKNIAVLWRPFHELDGGWFWWSKGGADRFKKLWQIMYNRYTDYWELDNLIWVLGYSGNGSGYDNWYPGDEYVDIAGADSYNEGANQSLYTKVKNVVGSEMPVCFHECGRIPTVKQLQDAKAGWVWFMTWHTEYITNSNSVGDLKSIYNDDYVITLDELPPL